MKNLIKYIRLSSLLTILMVFGGAMIEQEKKIVMVTGTGAASSLSFDQVKELYYGKLSTLDGQKVSFLDHQRNTQIYEDFLSQIFSQSKADMSSYWAAEQRTTGKKAPKFLPDPFLPKALGSIKGSISYYYEGEVPAGLTVIALTK